MQFLTNEITIFSGASWTNIVSLFKYYIHKSTCIPSWVQFAHHLDVLKLDIIEKSLFHLICLFRTKSSREQIFFSTQARSEALLFYYCIEFCLDLSHTLTF